MIFLVDFKVFSELVDSGAEDCYLYLGTTRILVIFTKLLYEFGFGFFGDRHNFLLHVVGRQLSELPCHPSGISRIKD